MIATKSVCALHLYVNRRDPLLAGRAKDARGGCSGFKESCQEEDACGENRKVGQANSRRYEIESILSWGFVRFSRIGQSSFSFRRNLSDHTAVKAVSRSAISGVPINLGLRSDSGGARGRKASVPHRPRKKVLPICSLDHRSTLYARSTT